MEVRILHRFRDEADYSKVYLVGETVTFEDERAEYLMSLGLVEKADDAKARRRATAARKTSAKAAVTE